MLVISWQYLTGHCVATDYGSRMAPEWPPHPDRVFQALVAAWGEGDRSEAGRRALEWLEQQPEPAICCPTETDISVRTGNTFYVPVNDASYSGKPDFGFPAVRVKKGRYFPTVWVGDSICSLIYPDDCPATLRGALEELCERVVYVGHSTSLVRMWVTQEAAEPAYVPSNEPTGLNLRVPSEGRLRKLVEAFAEGGEGWRRPPQAKRVFYVSVSELPDPVCQGPWDSDFFVFRQVSGRRLGASFAPLIANLFRRTLMSHAEGEAVGLSLISGHEANGAVLQRDHACVFPLPFVDSPSRSVSYADGHLMGIGLAMPRGVSSDERFSVVSVLAASASRGDRIVIADKVIGELAYEMEMREKPALTLSQSTWSKPSTVWASVSPIAIDRMPPKSCRDRDAWDIEEIKRACVQRGLPEPSTVLLSDRSAFSGAARSKDFPAFRRHGLKRFHTHAVLFFAEPVSGPLMIGMGKYMGYGLLRPLRQ